MSILNSFIFDARSLRAFRVFLGMLVVYEALSLWSSREEFFGLQGLLPLRGLPSYALIFIHGALACCGVALILNLYSVASALAAWAAIQILSQVNPAVFIGADSLLQVLLLWSPWMRAGTSMDSTSLQSEGMGIKPLFPQRGAIICLGYCLQLAVVYWVSAIFKAHAAWRTDFTAVELALKLESFQTCFSEYLLAYPSLTRMASAGTLWLEEMGPLLLLILYRWERFRLSIVLCFILFHLGAILPFLNVGHFPFVCAVAWIPVTPRLFWDRLCPGWKFVPQKSPSTFASISKASRVRKVAEVAWVIYALAAGVFGAVSSGVQNKVVRRVFEPAQFFGLQRRWAFFAPRPRTRDGWFVTVCHTASGDSVLVDAFGRTSTGWDKPIPLRELYPDIRWRQYLLDLFHSRRASEIESYATWLRSKASSLTGFETTHLEIMFMLQDSFYPADGTKKIQIFPIARQEEGKAVFPEDVRHQGQ